MSSNIVYLVTGANRGIGLGLAAFLLLRANTTVIATIRNQDTSAAALNAHPKGLNSRLIVTTLSSTSDSDAARMIDELVAAHGIAHLDTIIANAGVGEKFDTCLDTPMDDLRVCFEVNTLGPIKLFQATYPLLKKSKKPKVILVSSSLGSIGAMEYNLPGLAYGVSKAAANYFVRKVHFEHEDIAALAVHPGWVKTANGQHFADKMGVAQPPLTLEESVEGVIRLVDAASRDTTSGSLVSYDGIVIPW